MKTENKITKNIIDFIETINENLIDLASNKKEENKVSELHMHKILFIIYGGFYTKFKKELFEPNFEAWKYGPVEIDYRSLYKENINFKNKKNKFDFTFDNKTQIDYLEKLVKKLLKFSPWSLVDYTHSLEIWKKNYNFENSKNPISKKDIFQTFESINLS